MRLDDGRINNNVAMAKILSLLIACIVAHWVVLLVWKGL